MKAEQQKKGVDIIDLGVGDPDLPTPDHIVASLIEAAKNPENHHYPSYGGLPAYRAAVADWYKKRFGVRLNTGKEQQSGDIQRQALHRAHLNLRQFAQLR